MKIKFFSTLILLAALGSNAFAQDEQAKGSDSWPDPDSASWKTGSVPPKIAFTYLEAGQSKDQVRSLLGVPHFSEGFFDPPVWTYKFMSATNNVCLFRVRFNDNRVVESTEWQSIACRNIYQLQP